MTNTIHENVTAAFTARMEYLEAEGLKNQVKNVRANQARWDTKMSAVLEDNGIAADFIAKVPSKAEREDINAPKIADKALTKVRNILSALAHNNVAALDPYTKAITRNMLSLRGSITNAESMITISDDASVKAEDGDIRTLRLRMMKGATTASAQAPTTRHALVRLGICSYDANKRTLSFTDTAIAEQYKALIKAK